MTPFHDDSSLNIDLFCAHAKEMLARGATGVTLFGTTGEGASIGLQERTDAISAVIASGVPKSVVTLGVCAPAIADALLQVEQGIELGVTQFLLLPPFYFKGSEDQGLYDWHAQLFALADPRAKFILYHIPQVTQVPLSVDLVLRLNADFPDRVMAIKDSAGQWDNTNTLLDARAIPVLVGDERLLHKAAAMGGAGSICGMANLYPERMSNLFDTHEEDADLSGMVSLIVSVPVIPALKQVMVSMTGDANWANLRAPLQPLSAVDSALIAAKFSTGPLG
ncbi:MAG: dihydrodipicolinate synthase family protein [Granulosicoccus sp.]|nr:dihydrodipicolinate synthase family protein [Granulosicoccus sp.]